MWHRPSRWTLAAFAFAVATGFIAWLILGRASRTIHLADGREFSIVAVTYGTNHVFEEGPPWARLVNRYGSRSKAYRFGFRSSGLYTSSVPSVMVWTRWSSSNSNAPPQFASVADEHGFVTEPLPARLNQTIMSNRDADRVLVAWQFENYPRLQNMFALRFYEYDLFRVRVRRDGEVTVRNPAPTAKPSPPAPAAPVHATNGVLDCTLVSLTCGGPPPRRPRTAKSALAPWSTAAFAFRENGLPTTNWTIKRIEAFGVTGNYFSSVPFVELEEGLRVARFTGAFWKEEPDWRLNVEVAPTQNFPAEGLWNIRLPAKDFFRETLVTNLLAEARGLNHFRLAIGPANVDLRQLGKPEQRIASLRANFTPAAPGLYADLARAVDDQGHELRITRSIVTRAGACEADMELPASAQFVDVTFAIQPSRSLEFRVRPQFVPTNNASTFPDPAK